MKITNKKILSVAVLFFALSFWIGSVSADNIVQENQFSYLFHLYYDNGKLVADKDYQFKYDLIAGPFVQESLNVAVPYRGEVISAKNKTEATFQFDPKQGNSSFSKGKISVKGPRFADAQKVNFYNNTNQLLLTLDVSGSSFCNDDGVCNSDVGENYNNCSNDCKPTPTPLDSQSVTTTTNSESSLAVILTIASVVVAIVVLLVWFIIKRRKINETIPPTNGINSAGL